MGEFYVASWQSGYEAERVETDPDKRPHRPATRWASEPPVIPAATASSVTWWCGHDECDWFHTWTMWPGDDPSVVSTGEFNDVVRQHRLAAH